MLFGNDSRDALEAIIAINKRILESIGLSTIKKAEYILQSEQLIEQVKRTQPKEDINKRIINNYQDFDQLCFTLGELDAKMSAHDFKKLNAYEFMRHKQLLQKSIAERPKK